MKKKYTVILTIIFMILAGAFELFQGTVAITPSEDLKVHFLDVGQGDSIFIELPTNETILIDASIKDASNKIINYLKKIVDINNTLSEKSYLNATVINRNLEFFSNTLTIDKGSNNGILDGLAVTFNGSLIGKITKVSNFNSVVKLITVEDSNNKISVKINNNDNYIYGLISGYKDGCLLISGIDTNEEIIDESIVTTTGLGGVFPSGILVGKVVGVTKDNFDLATTVLVKSEIDFNDINFVTVLKRVEEWI